MKSRKIDNKIGSALSVSVSHEDSQIRLYAYTNLANKTN